jgi:tetratricopeptide (TPR) repeat protein
MIQVMIMAWLDGNGSGLVGEGLDEKGIQDMISGKLDDDLSFVDREIERDSESWEAWGARADILFTMGRYAESLQCCDRSLALNPETPLSWSTRGDILCKLQRCDEAAQCYRRAAELDPIYLIAWRRAPSGRHFQAYERSNR